MLVTLFMQTTQAESPPPETAFSCHPQGWAGVPKRNERSGRDLLGFLTVIFSECYP